MLLLEYRRKFTYLFFTAVMLQIPFSVYAQYRDDALKIVDTLASPYMAGRGYVNKGNERAAAYIEDQFRTIHLQAFTKNYTQPFTYDINTFPENILCIIDSDTLVPGVDFIMDAGSGPADGTYKVERIDSNTLKDPDKIRRIYKEEAPHTFLLFYKSEMQGDLYGELIGLLRQTHCLNRPGVLEITADKLTMDMSTEELPYAHFIIRAEKVPPYLRSIYLHVKPRFIRNFKTQNIAGYIPGTEKPDTFLVFTAHYDHLGMMGQNARFPGANDNASGVAMLLELAKYYTQPGNAPKYSMAFIAFSGEEPGLLGSTYYVEHPLFDLGKIQFLINMDIVGTGDEGIKIVNGAIYTDQFNRMDSLNESGHFIPDVLPRGKAANSDHYPFTEKNVPAFFIYTLGGIKAYHDVYDKAETLPLTAFDGLLKLLVAFDDGF